MFEAHLWQCKGEKKGRIETKDDLTASSYLRKEEKSLCEINAHFQQHSSGLGIFYYAVFFHSHASLASLNISKKK